MTTPDYGELVRRLRYADQDLDHGKIAKVKATCWEAHIAIEQQARQIAEELAAARREKEEMRERVKLPKFKPEWMADYRYSKTRAIHVPIHWLDEALAFIRALSAQPDQHKEPQRNDPLSGNECKHDGWSFEKHGRCCFKCGVHMVDWGD